jgi:hypothetical protein
MRLGAIAMPSHRTYLLISRVVAFRQDTKQVLTIPAGALIKLPVSVRRLGIEHTTWGGHAVMVFREDVEENGVDGAVARQIG